LEGLEKAAEREFQSNRTILAFDEYLTVLGENPAAQLRGSARYAADMMDHFGREELPKSADSGTPPIYRFKIFQSPPEPGARRVVGLEAVQSQIYRTLKTFARQGQNNRMILLHGPNGSAKSSLVHALMQGLESYSRTPEGAIYSFNWIFPVDKVTKGGIGLGGSSGRQEPASSFAHLTEDEVAARLPCELRDHPILLIPQRERRAFLASFLGEQRGLELWNTLPVHLQRGDLCHRCKQVAEALLVSHQGNLKRLLMHVQVERIYLSRRYRKGLVTIEPQLHVDAQYQQLTLNRNISQLPPALQGMNLFTVAGDLIDGNRGVIEFSDLLKRPVDSFKYILGLCESQSVNIGHTIAYLDTLFIGSANEVQLDAFKEFPDFTSFKARMSLVRVPYLLEASSEAEIYREIAEQVAGDKHVAPHATWTAALWAVLTRLKKPNGVNYSPAVSQIVSALTPLEKGRLYDSGEMPASLGAEDRKVLRSHLPKIRDEYEGVPYYEGRLGASAREMKSILLDAAQNPEFPCLSPLAVLREMEGFVRRVSEHEFLKQDVKDGYHDAAEFIATVRNEYLNRLDSEVRESIGLYDSRQWEEFIRKYVQHLAIALKKEKIKNPITGRMEDPDHALIEEFEKIVEAPGRQNAESDDLRMFRQNIISQVGAWSLDHPTTPVVYGKVFPEYWQKLEKHYYESQKAVLTKLHDALLVYGKDGHDPESRKLAQDTIRNMTGRLGYCEQCSKEVITFLLKSRY
jgi:serine protein kinase